MTIKRKFFEASVSAGEDLGPRQVRVIISTEGVDRAGDIVRQDGLVLANFLQNPIILWNHDQNFPIANALEITRDAGVTTALVEFFPEGVDETADRVCRMVKAGLVKGVSIGFNPITVKPLQSGAFDFTESELLEFSFVSIPAQPDALVVQRSAGAAGPAAGPVIRVTGPMTDEQRKRLSTMWTAYKSGAAPIILEPGWELVTRAIGDGATAPKLVVKSLYDVAWMADLLNQFGYLQSNVEWEAAYEEDGSAVPAMLADGMQRLGEALVAMTTEEVAEMLARCAGEEGETRKCASCGTPCMTPFCGNCGADCSALSTAATTKAAAVTKLKTFTSILKAGRVLSASNEADIKAAVDLIGGAGEKLGTVLAQVQQPDETDAQTVEKAERERRVKALQLAVA
ncbi:hypothetical protein TSH100_04120 [Azospirillum sp. TSH100]|uniref:HK97 family phage prohead protease n=1 Tax=Azospirillum sp. TSH100 TaxID=652764 RepID=UPI000D618201|nr:HK97 family phage prohead protease [Azospirillum sp. TSH100]PWC89832.1 hypothetical protein TSH100_04120 [Azospirillum sp. TSH100]